MDVIGGGVLEGYNDVCVVVSTLQCCLRVCLFQPTGLLIDLLLLLLLLLQPQQFLAIRSDTIVSSSVRGLSHDVANPINHNVGKRRIGGVHLVQGNDRRHRRREQGLLVGDVRGDKVQRGLGIGLHVSIRAQRYRRRRHVRVEDRRSRSHILWSCWYTKWRSALPTPASSAMGTGWSLESVTGASGSGA